MAKLKLLPTRKPTFTKSVKIPVPGAVSAEIGFRFKWRTRDEMREWIETINADTSNVAILRDMLDGWELEDEFNDENVGRMDQEFPGACAAIYAAYLSESTGAKTGN